jgi:hypothetical protein
VGVRGRGLAGGLRLNEGEIGLGGGELGLGGGELGLGGGELGLLGLGGGGVLGFGILKVDEGGGVVCDACPGLPHAPQVKRHLSRNSGFVVHL